MQKLNPQRHGIDIHRGFEHYVRPFEDHVAGPHRRGAVGSKCVCKTSFTPKEADDEV